MPLWISRHTLGPDSGQFLPHGKKRTWKTRRQWPHILRQHTWEGLTYTVKPLAGRWPFSQKLIGRHTRRQTYKGITTDCRSELTSTKKRKWSYHTVVQSARVFLVRRLKYRTVCVRPLSLLLECDVPLAFLVLHVFLSVEAREERPDHVEVFLNTNQYSIRTNLMKAKSCLQLVLTATFSQLGSPVSTFALVIVWFRTQIVSRSMPALNYETYTNKGHYN